MNIGFIGQRYSSQSPSDLHDKMAQFFVGVLERTIDAHPNEEIKMILSTGAGVDLPMIDAVKRIGLPAELVVPFHDHTDRWPQHLAEKYAELADGMTTVELAPKYAYGVYDMRNAYIAKQSDNPLWVFWDGFGDEGFCRVLGMIAKPGMAHSIWNLAGDWGER